MIKTVRVQLDKTLESAFPVATVWQPRPWGLFYVLGCEILQHLKKVRGICGNTFNLGNPARELHYILSWSKAKHILQACTNLLHTDQEDLSQTYATTWRGSKNLINTTRTYELLKSICRAALGVFHLWRTASKILTAWTQPSDSSSLPLPTLLLISTASLVMIN